MSTADLLATRGRAHGLLWAPAQKPDARLNGCARKASFRAPFLNRLRDSVYGYPNDVSAIYGLLAHGYPLAVLWTVVPVYVHSFYRRIWRGLRAHVLEKGSETIPSRINLDAAPSVVWPIRVIRVVAPIAHSVPGCKFWGVRKTMLASRPTSTTGGFAAHECLSCNRTDDPARASANPHRLFFLGRGPFQDGPEIKAHAVKISDGDHAPEYTRISLYMQRRYPIGARL